MQTGGKAVLAATLCWLAATAAEAGVTVHTRAFLASPERVIGFEGLAGPKAAMSYSENGITVSYVGIPSVGDASDGLWTTSQVAEGVRSWYVNGGGFGYTRLQFDSEVTAFQFAAGSGWLSSPSAAADPHLQYRILRGGALVDQGRVGGVKLFSGFGAFGFSGVGFDEVHLQSLNSDRAFDEGGLDALTLDALATGGPIGMIPEPGTWAMLIVGFGLVGLAARRKPALAA